MIRFGTFDPRSWSWTQLLAAIAWSTPFYISIPVAYVAARGASAQLPHAHSRSCRLATTVAVTLSTSVVAFAAEGCFAGLTTAVLPQPWLWWPKAAEDVAPSRRKCSWVPVLESKEDVLAWVHRSGRNWRRKLENVLNDENLTPSRKTGDEQVSLEHWGLAVGLD